jgi:leucyl-tRNA synthetase
MADRAFLVEDSVTYPVSFNGKVRFKVELAASMPPPEVEAFIRTHDKTLEQLGDKAIRKVIVVPGRIVNVVA